jgi:hypothetical protein
MAGGTCAVNSWNESAEMRRRTNYAGVQGEPEGQESRGSGRLTQSNNEAALVTGH